MKKVLGKLKNNITLSVYNIPRDFEAFFVLNI